MPVPFGLRADMILLKRRPLACMALFWAIGACAGYYGNAPWQLYLLPCALFMACAIWKKRAALLCAAFLFTAAALTGALSVQPQPIEKQKAILSGTACTPIQVYDEYAIVTLRGVSIDEHPYPHRVRLYLYEHGEGYPEIAYGDEILAEASISSPKGETGFGAYDQAASLWRKGIALTGNAGSEDIQIAPGADSPMRKIYRLRDWISERIAQLYPRNAALSQALLLGDKTLLTDEEYEAFEHAGIVHLLAVSGLHVSVLAEAVRIFLHKVLRLSRKAAYWTVLPLLFVFASVTGFPSSILRAIVCFALMDAAALLSRPADRITGLSAAYLLLSWLNPLSAFEAGFQLSFGAMLGLCLISPVLQSALTPAFFMRTKLRQTLWSPVSVLLGSLSVTISTLPICANLFGGLTLWSLLANIIAIPLSTAILPLQLISLFVPAMAIFADWLLGVLQWIADKILALPADLFVNMPRMHWGFLACYALIGLVSSAPMRLKGYPKRKASTFKLIGIALVLAVAIVSCIVSSAPVLGEDGLRVTFIDVGQGDSALVNAQGTCFMIDTGESHAAASRLTGRAIKLEALFLTHPDGDHAGAAADVIEAGAVRKVYLPACWEALEVSAEISEALSECEITYLAAGDIVQLSKDVSATVLHPPREYTPETDNAASLVLLVEYGEGSALFMGDIADRDIEFSVPDCDILKLAHHGSAYSSGARMLAESAPSAAILSVGLNGYGHPAEEVLKRLDEMRIPVFRTDEHGDITAQIFPEGGASISCYVYEEHRRISK